MTEQQKKQIEQQIASYQARLQDTIKLSNMLEGAIQALMNLQAAMVEPVVAEVSEETTI